MKQVTISVNDYFARARAIFGSLENALEYAQNGANINMKISMDIITENNITTWFENGTEYKLAFELEHLMQDFKTLQVLTGKCKNLSKIVEL